MTNKELEDKITALIQSERSITNELLILINTATDRKLYLDKGYSTPFDWLTRGLGYSQPAAARRLQAARLLRSVPDAAKKLQTGEVNLTTLAKTQSLIRWQEKISGDPLSMEAKASIVEKIENKSLIDTERTLYKLFPELIKEACFECKTVVSDSVTKISMSMSYESLKNLERTRDLLSHKLPQASLTDVVVYLVNEFLNKKDPLKKVIIEKPQSTLNDRKSTPTVSANPSTRTSPQQRQKIQTATRLVVFQRAGYRCEYQDPESHTRCTSTYQLEIDHIYPIALGGTNTLENLRCLCRNHNTYTASQIFNLPTPPRWTSLLQKKTTSSIPNPGLKPTPCLKTES